MAYSTKPWFYKSWEDTFKGKYIELENGCYKWLNHKTKDGYGVMRFNSVDYKSHRLSYILRSFKEIPKGMFICHKCDFPSCINPNHLFLGTHKQNMRDMVEKGRSTKGEDIFNSKLNEHQVLNIKKSLNLKENGASIAKRYNVTRGTIQQIKKGLTWRHIKFDKPIDIRRQKCLKKSEIWLIKKLLTFKVKSSDIAKMFKVSNVTISVIKTGKRWSNVKYA